MKYKFPMIVWAAISFAIKRFKAPFVALRSLVLCWAYGVVAPLSVRFYGKTLLRTRNRGEISIGDGVVFDADYRHNLVGLCGPTIIDTRHGGHIRIGDNSGFSSVVMSSKKEIIVGRRVKCGGNVRIFDHDFHSLSPVTRANYDADVANIRSKQIQIGDDVFVGTNAIILKGTRIGSGSIVAAGSVVFGLDVPPNSLVKGNPAFVVEDK